MCWLQNNADLTNILIVVYIRLNLQPLLYKDKLVKLLQDKFSPKKRIMSLVLQMPAT